MNYENFTQGNIWRKTTDALGGLHDHQILEGRGCEGDALMCWRNIRPKNMSSRQSIITRLGNYEEVRGGKHYKGLKVRWQELYRIKGE